MTDQQTMQVLVELANERKQLREALLIMVHQFVDNSFDALAGPARPTAQNDADMLVECAERVQKMINFVEQDGGESGIYDIPDTLRSISARIKRKAQ